MSTVPVSLFKGLWEKYRFIRFCTVGGVASLLQLVTLEMLTRRGIPEALANTAGIVAGACIGYPLNRLLTFADRVVNNQAVAWTTFMTIAFCAFVANESTFVYARHLGFFRLAASVLGIVAGVAVTWTGNNFLTFRKKMGLSVAPPADDTAHLYDLSIIVPAYNEASRIGRSLEMLSHVLGMYNMGKVEVIVVAAKGTDNTAEIAESLASFFSHFTLVRPGPRVGKGRDVRAGMAIARGRYRMFMDADMATPLRHLAQVRKFMQRGGQIAIGSRNVGRYHNRRSRNIISVINSTLTRLIAIPGIRDARCGFKVFEARIAEQLFGRMTLLNWGFDTEILAIAAHLGYTIEEMHIPDWFDPKEEGNDLVGDRKLGVLLEGVIEPFRIRLNLLGRTYRKPAPRHKMTHQAQRRTVRILDRSMTWLVMAAATALSIVSYVVVARHHEVLRFSDSNSYLLVARRVVDGTTPGFAQFGGSWLPVPSALQSLTIWNNTMYQTGLAGSIWSMVAFVVSCVLLYLLVKRMTGKKVAGLISAAVFASSVYVLYLQTTPMSELLMFATMIATVYCFQQWIDTDRLGWLAGTTLSTLLATIVRYEAWPLTILVASMATYVAWRRTMPELNATQRRRRALDRLVIALPICFAGIVGWFVYCQVIFHNALYFVFGTFAKPPVGSDPAIGHPWTAVKTYGYAMTDTIGGPILLLGLLGLVVFVVRAWRHKERVTHMLPALSLLIVIPFYIFTIYTGQRPLDVVQLAGYNYNVRYGLLPIMPAAVFIGYFVGTLKRPKVKIASVFTIVALILSASAAFAQQGIGQLVGIEHATTASVQAEAAFRQFYPGGRVLMQSWGNEFLAKNAVPVNELVYEGSNGLWQPALRSPIHNQITTIVMSVVSGTPDTVSSSVNTGELSYYRLVWHDSTYRIYVAKTHLVAERR